MSLNKQSGQALVEFVLVLIFALIFTGKIAGFVADFTKDTFGNFAHVLSINLTTGTCPTECFFTRYKNGYTQ